MWHRLPGLMIAILLMPGVAQAELISITYEFEARDFVSIFGHATPPQSEVMGRFQMTYNSMAGNQENLVPDWIELQIAGFTYTPENTRLSVLLLPPSNGALIIGGIRNGLYSMTGRTDDFTLVIDTAVTRPGIAQFMYGSAGLNDFFAANTESARIVSKTILPIPAPPGIVLGGFGLIVFGYSSIKSHFRRRLR